MMRRGKKENFVVSDLWWNINKMETPKKNGKFLLAASARLILLAADSFSFLFFGRVCQFIFLLTRNDLSVEVFGGHVWSNTAGACDKGRFFNQLVHSNIGISQGVTGTCNQFDHCRPRRLFCYPISWRTLMTSSAVSLTVTWLCWSGISTWYVSLSVKTKRDFQNPYLNLHRQIGDRKTSSLLSIFLLALRMHSSQWGRTFSSTTWMKHTKAHR